MPLLLILMTKSILEDAIYYSRALPLMSCFFMDPFSLEFTFEDTILASSCQFCRELFNFALLVNKQRQDFQTMLSAIISVFQNHPWSPCLLLLKIWSMFHLIFNKDSPIFMLPTVRWKSAWTHQSLQPLLFHLSLPALTTFFPRHATVPCLRPVNISSHLRACLARLFSFSAFKRFHVAHCSFYLSCMLAADFFQRELVCGQVYCCPLHSGISLSVWEQRL